MIFSFLFVFNFSHEKKNKTVDDGVDVSSDR
jgi:hypothetical protein